MEFFFWKLFREVVSNIPTSWDVLHNKLLLSYTINQPEEAHVHGLRPFDVKGS